MTVGSRTVESRRRPGGVVPVAAVPAGLVAVGLLLGACGTRESPDEAWPSDAALETAVESVEGVTEADIRYREEFAAGTGYVGDVQVDSSADPLCVLDTVWAILWQGRPGLTQVTVHQGDDEVDASDAPDLPGAELTEFEARYGERPNSTEVVRPAPPPYCD